MRTHDDALGAAAVPEPGNLLKAAYLGAMAQFSPIIWVAIGAGVVVLIAVIIFFTRRGKDAGASVPAHEIPASLRLPVQTLTMGGYRVDSLMAESQYAMTYKALAADGTAVMLKIPSRLCLADPDNLKRFGREGQ